jgi:hypothetical protein
MYLFISNSLKNYSNNLNPIIKTKNPLNNLLSKTLFYNYDNILFIC